jgi:hypothetical protein
VKDLRPCIVNGKKALFHTFEQFSKIVPPSLMVGGDNGGVMAEVFAIVEYEDGKVGRAYISELIFTDRNPSEHTAQPQQQRKKPTEEKTKCNHCKDDNNQNAVIYADTENKEYFVYCRTCGIETVETFKSKKAATNAFNSGEVKKIKEG